MKYLSLKKYLQLAEITIARYGPKNMLRSEDAISFVAEYMMRADTRYHSSHKTSRKNFRRNAGHFGVLKWIFEFQKNREKNSRSKSYNKSNIGYIEHPWEKIIERETIDEIKCSNLSDVQKQCVLLRYLDNMIYKDIAQKLDISTEWARQQTKFGINNLRQRIQF